MDDEHTAPAAEIKFDTIGYWSEIKLDILKDYAAAYSKILSARNFYHVYIDAFAGAGLHISKTTGEFVKGSPFNALHVAPPFREYHFVDLDRKKVNALEELAKTRDGVHVYHGDCNQVLMDTILPRARYEDYRRALCVLDPYGLQLDWKVLAEAGRMRSVDIFLNFPVGSINRNVLWRHRAKVPPERIKLLDAVWGGDWSDELYREKKSAQGDMFGGKKEKVSNEEVAAAFRRRLKEVAGFKHVPEPMAMRNTQNAIVYYLYFASQKPVAEDIVQDIFKKYRDRRDG